MPLIVAAALLGLTVLVCSAILVTWEIAERYYRAEAHQLRARYDAASRIDAPEEV